MAFEVVCTHDDNGAADRDGDTKAIVRCPVFGQQLGDLLPRGRVEQVRCAGIGAVVVVFVCPYDSGGATDRNAPSGPVPIRAVVGQKLGYLRRVRGVRDVEEVRRGLVGAATAGSVMTLLGAGSAAGSLALARRADD